MSDYTSRLLFFWIVACRLIQGLIGLEGSLCYLKKQSDQQAVICFPVTTDTCSSDTILVTSVMVYVIPKCSATSKCKSGADCCSPGNLTSTTDLDVHVIRRCTSTQCLSGLGIDDLPMTGPAYHLVEFIFNCVDISSPPATTLPTTTTMTTADVMTTVPTPQSNSTTAFTKITAKQSQTGVYVAVPVVLVLLAVGVAVTLFFIWRKRRQKSNQTNNAGTKNTFSTSAQNKNGHEYVGGDSVSDESGFGDYSEINSDSIGEKIKAKQSVEDTEYNTLNLRNLPVHSDPNYGFLAAKNPSADATYSSIQDQKTAETDDMYSHIGGAAQNVNNDVIPDHTYNTAANVPRLTTDVINENEDTYNHIGGNFIGNISDKGKNDEFENAYSKIDKQDENNTESSDEPVRHDYFVLEKDF